MSGLTGHVVLIEEFEELESLYFFSLYRLCSVRPGGKGCCLHAGCYQSEGVGTLWRTIVSRCVTCAVKILAATVIYQSGCTCCERYRRATSSAMVPGSDCLVNT
jgi:hypothetical protein